MAGATRRSRQRPDRLLADKGYPPRVNRAWLGKRGIATTIPERDDRIAHRRKRPGRPIDAARSTPPDRLRPIDFGGEQRQRYWGRNVVGCCFDKLKQ